MNIYKRFLAYTSFYTKNVARNILASDFCVDNRFYADFVRQRSLSRIRKYEKKFQDNSIYPCTIEIELTNFCNFDCIFCPNAVHIREKGIMSFQTFKNIIDEVENFKRIYIVFSGFGESLLDREMIDKLDYLYEKRIASHVELVTNGFLLTEKMCQSLCKRKLVDVLNISVDAAGAETYRKIHAFDGFSVVMQNLEYLNRIKKTNNQSYPFVSVRFKTFSFNKGQFSEFVKKFNPIANEIKAYVNIFRWPESEIKIDSIEERKFIRIVCPNLWEGIRINWNGDVVLCCMDYEGKVVLGNINEQTLINIWNGSQIQNYRDRHKKFQFNYLKICRDCDINSHLIIPW